MFIDMFSTNNMKLFHDQLLHPEDGGSVDLRNVVILPQHHTASQPRRPRLESSQL